MWTYIRMLLDLVTMRSGVAHRQRGATMIEYALIVALISVVVLAVALLIGPQLNTVFQSVVTSLTTANAT